MNCIYHINLIDADCVNDHTYQERLATKEWFSTPTEARAAAENQKSNMSCAKNSRTKKKPEVEEDGSR